MRFILATLLAHCTVLVHCAPTITPTTPTWDPSYDPETPQTYSIIPSPGASPISLNGTMTQVYQQVLAINPNYESDWDAVFPLDKDETSLEPRREKTKPKSVHCDVKEDGSQNAADNGIEYIRTAFKVRPGLPGHTCHTVSCSYSTAIRWCNDRPTLRLLEWEHIANAAQVIVNWCSDNFETGGWKGHNDGWRVFVDYKDC